MCAHQRSHVARQNVPRDQIHAGTSGREQSDIPGGRNRQQDGGRNRHPAPKSGGWSVGAPIGLAHGNLNALAQASGCTIILRMGPDAGAQFQKLRVHPGARTATRQMLRDLDSLGRIQFIVQIRLQQTLCRHAGHLESSFIRVATQSRRLWRARDSRDMTVPIGALAASAISR